MTDLGMSKLSALVLIFLVVHLSSYTADALSTNVDPDGFRYGFSECVDNARMMFFYLDEAATCSNDSDTASVVSKPPVQNMPCDVDCPRGYFLGANFTNGTPQSACERCPEGQYSLGGGKLFSDRTNAWTTPLPIDIQTDCVTRNVFSDDWQANCNPWVASDDGSMIISGDNGNVMDNFQASRLFANLRISATFVRPGRITFLYRVDAEEAYDGLLFQVDDDTVMPMVSQSDDWEEAVFEVEAGAHSLSWVYTKDYMNDIGEDRAGLKVIEIEGTAHSDTYCRPCGGEMTMTGGSLCAFCDVNEYADAKSDSELDFKCYSCPEGTSAPKGSIGPESCVTSRPCSDEDLVESFSNCRNGRRNVTYDWSEPLTCELTHTDSISIPPPDKNVPCHECPYGLQLLDDNTCSNCPDGQRLNMQKATCEACPQGQIAVNGLAYGLGTSDAWSSWPAIFDVDATKGGGWKLTKHGLEFSSQQAGATHSRGGGRYPVVFNASFTHSGHVNITYHLSHVPTMEQEGSRAWLELEAKDITDSISGGIFNSTQSVSEDASSSSDSDDVSDARTKLYHLEHGAENGSFSVLIRFNVSEPVTKQFRLVLRTTSKSAMRQVRARVKAVSFLGTKEGGGVQCGSCPVGSEPVMDNAGKSTQCRICPAGTFSKTVNGLAKCTSCPANTYSTGSAEACTPCGENTLSEEGASLCAPPSILDVNESEIAQSLSYNLSQLQEIAWGNSIWGIDEFKVQQEQQQSNRLSTEPTTPEEGYDVSNIFYLFTGVLRPLTPVWEHVAGGSVSKVDIDTEKDTPYIARLTMTNPKDAGSAFVQSSPRYGKVMCSAPALWKVSSGGSKMDVQPFANGTGIRVVYSEGSLCKNGAAATTSVDFICDLTAGFGFGPTLQTEVNDREDVCDVKLEWRTMYACPMCTDEFFTEEKTTCSGGEQRINYKSMLSCYGGLERNSVDITTCSDVVLGSDELFSVYAALSFIGIFVVVLLTIIFVVYRKYRHTYNEFIYLKGRVPNMERNERGEDVATFEFSPSDTGALTSPGPIRSHGFEDSPNERDDPLSDSDDDMEEVDLGPKKNNVYSV